jgi:hypothetical protein
MAWSRRRAVNPVDVVASQAWGNEQEMVTQKKKEPNSKNSQ